MSPAPTAGVEDEGATLEDMGRAFARAGQLERARAAWLSAVCPEDYPDPSASPPGPDPARLARCSPRAATEGSLARVWSLLGQSFFDEGELACARAAFERADQSAGAEPELRAVVRYRLAWTLYRMEEYAKALDAFVSLLDASPATVATEALEYAAIIIAEPDWDGDGEQDAALDLARPEVRARLDGWSDPRRILLALARALVADAEGARAIAVCDVMLERWPSGADGESVRALRREAEGLRDPHK